ncbi:hypothetical protein HL666_33485 [Bradyrhizobium sp. 83002]|uniref:hypothetical protein n=1 Tax=Bradyrhizobium aeschynomenes TaxID=2734909 RepID=UPI001552119D|nr:hypothetical protein [Bradyrhizobium aeschynomenes]NPU15677.1 hypothetical protein [Bradyrhizobium aeschynomenes]
MTLSQTSLACVVLYIAAAPALAVPPSSCASKFVGTWQHGTSNIGTLTADGRAACTGNPFCVQGTWTCNGNSLTYTNSAGTYVYTLQSNGVMTYGSIVVTRIGAQGSASASARIKSTAAAPGKPATIGPPIQAEYQPRGSQPLRAGKKIAADPAPAGLDTSQQGAWDTNEMARDYAKKLPKWNPAKYPLQKYTDRNRENLEEAARKQQGGDEDK